MTWRGYDHNGECLDCDEHADAHTKDCPYWERDMSFLDLLREEFEKTIGAKTGWGKNEIMVAFDKASIKALVRLAEKKGIDLT